MYESNKLTTNNSSVSFMIKYFSWTEKDANDDIGGAHDSGMAGILVRTGKYRENDEEKLKEKPLFVADNFASAVDFILKNYKL